MGSNDQAAVVFTGGPATDSQDFTANRALVLAAIGRTMGGRGFGSTIDARNTAKSIREMFAFMRTVPTRRKALLFFSEQWVTANADEQVLMDDSVWQEAQDAIDSAGRSDVSIYPIDPRGLEAPGDIASATGGATRAQAMNQLASMRAFAADTCSFAIVNTNNFGDQFESACQTSATRARSGIRSLVNSSG